jgi:hypothetical protein
MFDDLYFVSGGANFTALKTNLDTKFGTSCATVACQFNGSLTAGSGVFQGNGTCVTANCLGSTLVQRSGGSAGNVGSEYVLNNGAFTNESLFLTPFTATTTKVIR